MIRTRFSPSPTGMLHLGNARTALFSALYALHSQGVFLLRIEDTDAARSEHQYTEILQDDLRWLGITWQEGPFWQSERHGVYEEYYQQLEQEGRAYPCFCTDQELALNRKLQISRGQAPRYPGTCFKLSAEKIAEKIAAGHKPALRFHVLPGTVVDFVDLVKGAQHFKSDDIGDFIIRRAEGTSSFMFCNAIDDSLMGVTHVLRGEDHLANTPRQLMILSALNLRTPQYGHVSLITGDDGSPLSKRHGSCSVDDLRKEGYLSHAVLNYLARLGHAYDEQLLLDFAELAKRFRLEKLSRSSARFDKHQLLHWQKESVMALSLPAVWDWLGDDLKNKIPLESQDLFADMMRQNIHFPSEAYKWADILFGEDLQFSDEQLAVLQEAGALFFGTALQQEADLKTIIDSVKQNLNISGKKLFMPIRVALTGEHNGPELVLIEKLLGHQKIRSRFERAYSLIK